jgi:hypothetical protein
LKKSSFLDRKGYDEKKNNKTTSLQQLFWASVRFSGITGTHQFSSKPKIEGSYTISK